MNRITFRPTNSANTFAHNARFPMPYERLVPGSLFRIVTTTRGKPAYSNDIYEKSKYGYYSLRVGTNDGAVLYPEELVMPVNQAK